MGLRHLFKHSHLIPVYTVGWELFSIQMQKAIMTVPHSKTEFGRLGKSIKREIKIYLLYFRYFYQLTRGCFSKHRVSEGHRFLVDTGGGRKHAHIPSQPLISLPGNIISWKVKSHYLQEFLLALNERMHVKGFSRVPGTQETFIKNLLPPLCWFLKWWNPSQYHLNNNKPGENKVRFHCSFVP